MTPCYLLMAAVADLCHKDIEKPRYGFIREDAQETLDILARIMRP
jgi:hypothetical protein